MRRERQRCWGRGRRHHQGGVRYYIAVKGRMDKPVESGLHCQGRLLAVRGGHPHELRRDCSPALRIEQAVGSFALKGVEVKVIRLHLFEEVIKRSLVHSSEQRIAWRGGFWGIIVEEIMWMIHAVWGSVWRQRRPPTDTRRILTAER